MSIEIHCTNCSQHVRVKSKYAGKRVHCPHCQHLVEVPETDGDSECGSSIAVAAPVPPPLPPPTAPPPAAPPPVELRPPALVPLAAPVTRKPRRSGWPVWLVTTACCAAIVLFLLVIYAVFTMSSGTGPFRLAPANQQTANMTPSDKAAATADASASRTHRKLLELRQLPSANSLSDTAKSTSGWYEPRRSRQRNRRPQKRRSRLPHLLRIPQKVRPRLPRMWGPLRRHRHCRTLSISRPCRSNTRPPAWR